MAPKKKKKPAANPARGFTTVSVPSKPRQDENPDDNLHIDEGTIDTPDDQVTATLHTKDAPAIPDICDLLPDQLEDYLEDAELQTLLDSDSIRCKSEAARQVTRLNTEIRQLRAQSVTLSTFGWLDDSNIERILHNSMTESPSTTSATDLFSDGDHKTLLHTWVLQQVLSSLAFPRVADALAYVLQTALVSELKTATGYTWGLTAALDWYALNVPLKELPDYQASPVQAADEGMSRLSVAENDGASILFLSEFFERCMLTRRRAFRNKVTKGRADEYCVI